MMLHHLNIHAQRMRKAAKDHEGTPNHEEVTRKALQRYRLDEGIVCQRTNKSLRQSSAACNLPITVENHWQSPLWNHCGLHTHVGTCLCQSHLFYTTVKPATGRLTSTEPEL